MNTFEDEVREKLGMDEEEDCFVWFVDKDLNPIEKDEGLRLVYCKGEIKFWEDIFN